MPNQLLVAAAIDSMRLVDLWPSVDPPDLPFDDQTGLSADAPILLLPVGLSARFSPDRTQLRVRIQPDTLHIDNHRYTLTAAERHLGEQFWANAASDRPAAWHGLVSSVGTAPSAVNRAMWIAKCTDPSAANPAEVEPSRRCLAMPDRWRIIAWKGDNVVATATSAPVSPDLAVDAPQKSSLQHAWLTDYDAAVAAGMAVTLDFDQPTSSVDVLLAVGVRSGSSAGDSAAELERLFAAHRYSDGIEFLSQGTPTNNTPETRAAWRSDPDPDNALHQELGVPTEVDGANVGVLARALGIDRTGALRSLPNGDLQEQTHARAMVQALWPVTGGEFLEVLLTENVGKGRLLPRSIEAFARDHAVEFVRARGPLPTIRVGRQPYGVLPVTSTKRWVPHSTEPSQMNGFHRRVTSLWPFWEAAVDQMPRVGRLADASGHGAAMVVGEILGQSPVPDPTGYVAWTVLPPNFSRSFDLGLLPNPVSGDLFSGLIGAGGFPTVADTKLATAHPATVICPTTDDQTPSRLSALGDIAFDYNALGAFPSEPTDLVSQLVQRGFMRALDRDVKSLTEDLSSQIIDVHRLPASFLQSALVGDLEMASATPLNMLTLGDVGFTHEALAHLNVADPTTITMTDMFLHPNFISDLTATWDGRTAAPEHGDAVVGVSVLAGLSPDQLSLLFGETVDLYSNRFDAWVTSLATRRLDTLRSQHPSGVHLGGYGWLVDVQARDRQVPATLPPNVSPDEPGPIFDLLGDAGVVHAPSVQHAATAAVLRHADLGDRADGLGLGDTERNFDLTSASARRARWLIEAMDAGQPLAALLGYRVERLLQDAGQADMISAIREACPLVAGEAVDHAENALTIPPHDVVDGLTLWRRLSGDLSSAGLPALPALPTSVKDDLAFSVDSMADLLVVEGVHHIVAGDHARAHATLTSLARGESPSTDLRSLDEMRDRLSIPVILAAAVTQPPSAPGWSLDRPRARIAPAAEAYAQRLLPAPHTCLVAVRLDDSSVVQVPLVSLQVCALDVLNDGPAAGEAGSLLEARFLAAAGARAVALTTSGRDGNDEVGWRQLVAVAKRARAVLSAARPLTVADVIVEQQQPVPPSDAAAASLTETRAALDAELGELAAATAALRNVLDQTADVSSAADLDVAGLAALQTALRGLEPFGVARSVLLPTDDLVGCARAAVAYATSAVDQRTVLSSVGDRVIEGAPNPAGQVDGSVSRIAQIARAAFGEATIIAPLVDLPAAVGPENAPAPQELEDWIGELAEVRRSMRSIHALWLGAESLGAPAPDLVGLQYPVVPGESWVGGFAGENQAWNPPRKVRRAFLFDRVGPAASPVSALVLDSWVEEIPLPDDEITGLAININASDARPPQSLLLAVPPDPNQPTWRLGDLVATLTETLELARFRAVEPPADLPIKQFLPLVYVPDGISGTKPFSQIFTSMFGHAAISNLATAHLKAFGS